MLLLKVTECFDGIIVGFTGLSIIADGVLVAGCVDGKLELVVLFQLHGRRQTHMKALALFDFIQVSSYGDDTKSSGKIKIMKDLDKPITDKDVLIIEDILDSGTTLYRLIDYLREGRPASLKVCTLLDKPARREYPVDVDYNGFEIEDEFVIGFGLDYAQRYRNLPYIGILNFVDD